MSILTQKFKNIFSYDAVFLANFVHCIFVHSILWYCINKEHDFEERAWSFALVRSRCRLVHKRVVARSPGPALPVQQGLWARGWEPLGCRDTSWRRWHSQVMKDGRGSATSHVQGKHVWAQDDDCVGNRRRDWRSALGSFHAIGVFHETARSWSCVCMCVCLEKQLVAV